VRRFWVTGTVRRKSQGLGDSDSKQTVRRVWVTGTVHRQCAGPVWQGQHMAQGQGDTQYWSKRQNSVK